MKKIIIFILMFIFSLATVAASSYVNVSACTAFSVIDSMNPVTGTSEDNDAWGNSSDYGTVDGCSHVIMRHYSENAQGITFGIDLGEQNSAGLVWLTALGGDTCSGNVNYNLSNDNNTWYTPVTAIPCNNWGNVYTSSMGFNVTNITDNKAIVYMFGQPEENGEWFRTARITVESFNSSGPGPTPQSLTYNYPTDASTNNTNTLFNLSCDLSADIAHLYFNFSTDYELVTNNSNYVLWESNVSTSGTYSYFGSCNNTYNASVRTWTYDGVSPQITINVNNSFQESNTSLVYGDYIHIDVTASDNIDLAAGEILLSNQSDFEYIFYNYTNLSLTSITELNLTDLINRGNLTPGTYYLSYQFADSHTDNDWLGAYIEKTEKKVEFYTAEDIFISLENNIDAEIVTEKIKDRYTIEYKFKKPLIGEIPEEKVFILKSDKELTYHKDSKYKGHFTLTTIDENGELKGNWIDFEGIEEIPIVEKETEWFTGKTYYRITIITDKSKIKFKSVGGLNVNSKLLKGQISNLTITSARISPSIPINNSDLTGFTFINESLNMSSDISYQWWKNEELIYWYGNLIEETTFASEVNCDNTNFISGEYNYFDLKNDTYIQATGVPGCVGGNPIYDLKFNLTYPKESGNFTIIDRINWEGAAGLGYFRFYINNFTSSSWVQFSSHQIDPGSGTKFVNSTITLHEDFIMNGTIYLNARITGTTGTYRMGYNTVPKLLADGDSIKLNSNIENEISTFSSLLTNVNDNITFSTRGFGGHYFTDWLNSSTIPIVTFGIDNCSVFNVSTLDIFFLDENNDAATIDYESTFIYRLSNETNTFTYSMKAKSISNNSFCLYPGNLNLTSDLEIQYTGQDGTIYNYFTFETTLNNNSQQINLYTQNDTTPVLFTVQDINTAPIENAFIHILKYDIGTGGYTTTEILKTDSQGQAIGNIILSTTFYNFLIYINGVLQYTEQSVKLVSTTRIFTLDLNEEPFFENFETTLGVNTRLYFNDTTQNFVYIWSDPTAIMHYGCLRVDKQNATEKSTLNNTCLETTSGTLIYNIPILENGTTYTGIGYLKYDNEIITDIVNKVVASARDFFEKDKIGSLFLSFLICLALVLIGIQNPSIAVIFLVLGLIFTSILGMLYISPVVLGSLAILTIIQIYLAGRQNQ